MRSIGWAGKPCWNGIYVTVYSYNKTVDRSLGLGWTGTVLMDAFPSRTTWIKICRPSSGNPVTNDAMVHETSITIMSNIHFSWSSRLFFLQQQRIAFPFVFPVSCLPLPPSLVSQFGSVYAVNIQLNDSCLDWRQPTWPRCFVCFRKQVTFIIILNITR